MNKQTTEIRPRCSGESEARVVHQQKIMGHAKKQKRLTHTQEKQTAEKSVRQLRCQI